jgi:hypothetical protein
MSILGLWIFWKPIREQVVLRYWQHRCTNFSEPPDRVVWEEDPDELRRLKTMPNSYRIYDFKTRTFAFRVPPPEYAHTQFGQWGPGPVFIHGRRGPDGVERLVVVGLDNAFNVGVVPYAIPPSGHLRMNAGGIGLALEPTDIRRVFAGQPDPKDESHFTIEMEVNGQRSTIDGWLRGANQVTLLPRNGETVPMAGYLRWRPPGSRANTRRFIDIHARDEK